jgi:hypothetical protein
MVSLAIYTLDAGRCVCRDGVPLFTLHRVYADKRAGTYTALPHLVDAYARRVVAALNAQERAAEEVLNTEPLRGDKE